MRRTGMRWFHILAGLGLIFLSACSGGGGGSTGPPPPTVTTSAATGTTLTGDATLNGSVNPNGAATEAWFEWGTDSNLVGSDNTQKQNFAAGTSVQLVSQQISGLSIGTVYFFRIVASNSSGTSVGGIQSFSITPVAPTVTTSPASALGITSATLNGTVNPNGLATSAWFQWGTDPGLASPDNTSIQNVGAGTAGQNISAPLTGLVNGQTYYFRVVATNSTGTSNGTILSFSTLNPPPVADAGPDNSVIMGQTAALDGSGSSTPVGVITSYEWEQLNGTPVTLSDNTAVSPTFQAPDNVALTGEVLRFQLTVTDDRAFTDTDTVDITVLWGAADDFSTDTRSEYTTVPIYLSVSPPPPPPEPEFNYDPVGRRLEILTANNVGLIFSRDFPAPAIDNGVFSLDFYPRQTYPSGGGIWVRLMQDNTTYYELAAFEWDNVLAPNVLPYFRKVVAGSTVDNSALTFPPNNYVSQDPNPTQYPVVITFTPEQSTVQAFGETVVLNTDNSVINVSRFQIQTNQQDAYYDNLMLLAVP